MKLRRILRKHCRSIRISTTAWWAWALLVRYQGQIPEAIEYFQTAIRSQPDAPKAHVQLALALWKQNDDQAALEEMRRASQLAPNDASIRADLDSRWSWQAEYQRLSSNFTKRSG